MVGAIESGSGPGVILYACPEHARTRARRWDAPEWLPGDVAAFDEGEAARGAAFRKRGEA